MPVKSTLVCTTGLKPKRSTSTKTSPSSVEEVQPFTLDIDASFSYCSSDEDDLNFNSKEYRHPLPSSSASTSPKSQFSKGLSNSDTSAIISDFAKPSRKMPPRMAKIVSSLSKNNSDISGKSKFLPLSQREKLKRAAKLMKQRQEHQEPPVSPHLTLADLVDRSDTDGRKLYNDSWRSRSNRSLTDNNLKILEQERVQVETFKDDRQRSAPGFIECILAAITSGGGCGGKNTTDTKGDNRRASFRLPDDTSLTSTDASDERESSTASVLSDSTLSENLENHAIIRYATPKSLPPKIEEATMQTCIDAIHEEKWNHLLRMINANPKLLTQTSSSHRKKNLLHILSGQCFNIPAIILVTMINLCPESVSQMDQDGCIPLHHMAFTGGKDNLVKILLESWQEGTTVRNVDGDIPLHVSVWAGKGNEGVADLLISQYPSAVGVINNAGGTPLHLACCEAGASPTIVRNIIQTQLKLNIPFGTLDKNGNTPLHIAIKTRSTLSILKTIYSELGSEPFCVPDKRSVYPLQMAMSIKDVDTEIVQFICTVAPSIMKKQMTNGMMPICMAIEQVMPNQVVKELLLADSPVKFMPLLPHVRDVVLRIHSHSWWYLATGNSNYAPVVDDILSNMATIHEIVSLCQEPDLNGYSSLLERANYDMKNVFLKNLLFCGRYKVAPEYKATVVKGLLLLCALDTCDGKESNNYNVLNEVYVPSSTVPLQNREVLLHCCAQDSDEYNELLKEMQARENFDFSTLHSQQLFAVHKVSAAKIGCSGEMLCLSFERPILTLQEIFETSRFRKRKNQQWARKSVNLLLSLARVLRYFHSVGYVHGSVEPATIGKFQGSNNWKMLDMRSATKVGEPMRGDLRYGAPPESISVSQVKTGTLEVVKLVSFDETFVQNSMSSQTLGSQDEVPAALEFNPVQCTAAPSWDIWSFGLIMGQLVLGQSMVLLPNFEKASDAHLRNLHQYDDSALEKISNAARRVSGDEAADLLSKLLQPYPEDRPQSMDEILNYRYFTKHELS